MKTSMLSKNAKHIVNQLETFATPMEFFSSVELIINKRHEDLKAAVFESITYNALKGIRALSPMRLELEAQKMRLYSRPGHCGKRLLVGFTGRALRFMMPLAIFQQALPEDTDLLVLYDTEHNHYRSAIFDGKSTLPQLPKLLFPIISKYSSVIAFGTSGGGFPAIRFGCMAGVKRSISIGGRNINDSLRMLRSVSLEPAYDPICVCNKNLEHQALLLFAGLHHEDAHSAHSAAAAINGTTISLEGSTDHSLLWSIQKMGKLDAFFDLFLDTNISSETLRRFISSLTT
jgi:hypothetical protein